MTEIIKTHKAEDVYSTPASSEKIELTAQFIAQDLASQMAGDIDVLYSITNELKSL